jgi:hypothetical protein
MFESDIQDIYDERIAILGKIKHRSLGALDVLGLTAFNALAYAQMEGGIKDLSACTIRNINARNMLLGEVAPTLLEWRSADELKRLKSAVNFNMVGHQNPFATVLARKVKIRGIHRHYEMNQMNSATIKRVYRGFGINPSDLENHAASIDELVEARNTAAHYGLPSDLAASLLAVQLRGYVQTAEYVLTDFAIKLIPYFSMKMHKR